MTHMIVDVDTTISDDSHRMHWLKEQRWEEYQKRAYLDPPIEPVCEILRGCIRQGIKPVYITGRPERMREETLEWIYKNLSGCKNIHLFMRSTGNITPTALLKKKVVCDHNLEGTAFAIDDKEANQRMYTDLGIPCLDPKRLASPYPEEFNAEYRWGYADCLSLVQHMTRGAMPADIVCKWQSMPYLKAMREAKQDGLVNLYIDALNKTAPLVGESDHSKVMNIWNNIKSPSIFLLHPTVYLDTGEVTRVATLAFRTAPGQPIRAWGKRLQKLANHNGIIRAWEVCF